MILFSQLIWYSDVVVLYIGMEVLPVEEGAIPNWICSLEEELGSLIWVSLRDDTFYVGIFKTFDQYGNVVLSDAVQKIVVPEKRIFSDLYNGIV